MDARISRLVMLSLAILLVLPTAINAKKHRRKKTTQSHTISAAHKERLSKQAELAKIRKQIAETEREISSNTKKEHLTKKQLAERDAKTRLLKAKLISLKAEAAELESQKEELDTSIKHTSSSIDTLKRSYASDAVHRYVTGVYRESPTNASGFDDPGKNTERLRNAYFAGIASSAMHHNKESLDSTKSVLTENREEVASLLSEQLGAISQTKQQQQSAEAERRRKAKELQDIQTKKASLQKELDKRKQAAKKLEAIVANLAAKEEAEERRKKEEIRKRQAERKKKRTSGKKLTPSEQRQEQQDIAEAKSLAGPHSLGWPTASHKIVQGFGEQRNRELGTVTMNLGIDIATAEGSSVKAAADGKVALVSSLPSYGSLVIVRHGGGVLTVYADLGGVSASTGATVKKNQQIARSGSNSELGAILHFEVWKGKSKQNPLRWLK
ncbi:MAG TPA: peptidoglycan DD-metalloendopeptidase family protein [Candidatus Kapabacteria bacterium]|nr:peptidoglycan DD-metalloendopeptidase family protein [Candidatus Kapabacteria bacterium]